MLGLFFSPEFDNMLSNTGLHYVPKRPPLYLLKVKNKYANLIDVDNWPSVL